MSRLFLLTVSGADRPGITSYLTARLRPLDARVLDVGQAVIHRTLSLGLLIEISGTSATPADFDALAGELRAMELSLRVSEVTPEAYATWVAAQGRERHIVTLLARTVSASQLAEVTGILAAHDLNIDRITRLSGRIGLDSADRTGRTCIEISARGPLADATALRRELLALGTRLEVDVAYQEDSIFRRHRRLVVFDMDSTLIQAEVIDELAKEHGVGAEVSAITERAMRGELDFRQSLQARVALLQGLPASAMETVLRRLRLTEGAARLLGVLHRLGYRTAIVSGGFTWFGRHIQAHLGIDHVHGNELEIVDGCLTGRVTGDIIDGEGKARLLRRLAETERVYLEQVIAVGDGANDLPMLAIAGLGIAFQAKPLVRESARQSVSMLGLDAVIYLLGISDREIVALEQELSVQRDDRPFAVPREP